MSSDKTPPIHCIAQYNTAEIITLCNRKIASIIDYRSAKAARLLKIKARLIAECREEFSESMFSKNRAQWDDQQIWDYYRTKCNAGFIDSRMPSEYTEVYRLSRFYGEYQMLACTRIKQAAMMCKEEKMWLTDEGVKHIA